LAAHIDVMPTLLDLCGVKPQPAVRLDGRSLAPLLRSHGSAPWPDRTLFFQWHRGDQPEPFRNSAALDQRWKLVNGQELYDLEKDAAESRDVSAVNPEQVVRLRREYETWFRDVSSTRGYAPPRIHIGTRQENPVLLTRQDWRGERAGNSQDSLGYWELLITRHARYEIGIRMQPLAANGELHFSLNGASLRQPLSRGIRQHSLGTVEIPEGPGRLEMEISAVPQPIGPDYVEFRVID
jgi:hypothetical protein